MSNFLLGNLFLAGSILLGSSSQIVFKRIASSINIEEYTWSALKPFMSIQNLAGLGIGGVLLVAGFVFWLLALTKLDLVYAYPVACSSLVLVSLLSVVLLGETLTPLMIVGTCFILLGVALMIPS